VDQSKTERLIALLHAQHHEAVRRSREVRGSRVWTEASSRLNDLNHEIMQWGSLGATSSEFLGDGLELDLDSHPADDIPFRHDVIASLRRAVIAIKRERHAHASRGRLPAASEAARGIRHAIRRAEADVRTRYPGCALAATAPLPTPEPSTATGWLATPEPATISLRADRDGRAA
jgi:hypothetical protein